MHTQYEEASDKHVSGQPKDVLKPLPQLSWGKRLRHDMKMMTACLKSAEVLRRRREQKKVDPQSQLCNISQKGMFVSKALAKQTLLQEIFFSKRAYAEAIFDQRYVWRAQKTGPGKTQSEVGSFGIQKTT